ncbi:unnamed protein product [Diplocarpon coronariae]
MLSTGPSRIDLAAFHSRASPRPREPPPRRNQPQSPAAVSYCGSPYAQGDSGAGDEADQATLEAMPRLLSEESLARHRWAVPDEAHAVFVDAGPPPLTLAGFGHRERRARIREPLREKLPWQRPGRPRLAGIRGGTRMFLSAGERGNDGL